MKTRSKKLLITGSHGYIGSVICPELQELGYIVHGLDNGYFVECLVNESVGNQTIIKKNLKDLILSDLHDIYAVIHLAGLQNDPLKNTYPGKVYDIEYEYTKRLADYCLKLGIKIIYASSCSVYGIGGNELLNEESSLNPLTPYSKNKMRTEKYLFSITNKNFNPIILRFATVYGYSPRMRFDLYINMFVGMALTAKKIQLNSDGLAWRPNLYIGDISKVLNSVLNHDYNEPTIINVGNHDSNKQVLSIINIIKDLEDNVLTSSIKPTDTSLYSDHYVTNKKDKRSYKVNFSKLNQIIGKEACPTNLNDGIKKLISNLKSIDNLKNKIKDPRFFRLQWTQELIEKKTIDREFQWKE